MNEGIDSISPPPVKCPRITRRRFIAGAVASMPMLGMGDALLLEPNWIAFERIEVPIRGLGDEFDGYRIALLADIHYPRRISEQYVRRAMRMAMRFEPDVIAIVGDFCDHKGLEDWRTGNRNVPDLSRLFEHAEAPDGVLGVLGNHDHWLDAAGVRAELARNTPVRLIENQSIVLERGANRLAIGGVGDLWSDVVDPATAFADVLEDVPRVMLSHNPDVAELGTGGVRVDLQLSGHTHGGEVRVPFGPAPRIPSRYGQKFRAGLVQGASHRVYVNRGLCSPRSIRFWCRPEVTGITLRSA